MFPEFCTNCYQLLPAALPAATNCYQLLYHLLPAALSFATNCYQLLYQLLLLAIRPYWAVSCDLSPIIPHQRSPKSYHLAPIPFQLSAITYHLTPGRGPPGTGPAGAPQVALAM